MKNKILPYIIVLATGAIANFATFIIWNSFHKDQWLVVVSIVSVLFIFLGTIAGMLKVHRVWLGWLALHAPTLVAFLPGILQMVFSEHFVEASHLLLFMLALTFVPMLFSLPAIFLARKYLAQKQAPSDQPNWKLLLRTLVFGAGNLLVPLLLGFVGMFVAMFTSFLSYQLKIPLPVEYFAYPLIYAVLAALLAMVRSHWLMDSLLVCFAPLVLWSGMQLWQHPDLVVWWDFNNQYFRMIFISAVLLVTAVSAGYLVSRWKKSRQQSALVK